MRAEDFVQLNDNLNAEDQALSNLRKDMIETAQIMHDGLNEISRLVDQLIENLERRDQLYAEQMRIDEEFYKHLDQTLLTS